jgi:hypothetical protein
MAESQFPHQITPGDSPHITRSARDDADAPRSSYGQVPGEEFPAAVYISVLIAFAGLLVAAWLLFDRSDEIGLDLIIATVLFTVMLGLPLLLGRTVSGQTDAGSRRSGKMRASHVEIYTGTISSGEAWLQILLIPVAMAFAAVALGIITILVS